MTIMVGVFGIRYPLTILLYAMPVSPKRVDQARVALVKDWATRGMFVVQCTSAAYEKYCQITMMRYEGDSFCVRGSLGQTYLSNIIRGS